MFDRNTKRDVTLEASRENSKPRAILKPRKVRNLSLVQVILKLSMKSKTTGVDAWGSLEKNSNYFKYDCLHFLKHKYAWNSEYITWIFADISLL